MYSYRCLFILILVVNLIAGCHRVNRPRFPVKRQTQVADEASVQQVIADETAAFVDRDSTRLFRYYADDAVTQSAWNNPDGTFGSMQGISQIQASFKQAFRRHPERQHLPQVERTDWQFKRLAPDWMWVNFTQKMVLTDGTTYRNYETRLMKKEADQWKISVMYALSDHGRPAK